jgi:hypothetical protein
MQKSCDKYFELNEAKTWAMYTLYNNTENIHLYLDVTNVDETAKWFLKFTPQYSGSSPIQKWFDNQYGNYMVFSRDNSTENIKNIYIHLFEDDKFVNSIYAGLYDEFGKRWCDKCLVMWNKNKPEINNPGYADGRCPSFIIL